MTRKSIATRALGLLLVPLVAAAQPAERVYRFGWLYQSESPWKFQQGALDALATFGYVDGKNLIIESRNAKNVSELPLLAAELVEQKVDLIITVGFRATRAAKQATSTIPIFFTMSGDPVMLGLVSSFSRPGGNLTGISSGFYEDKMLEVLKQAMPGLVRVACICSKDPNDQQWNRISTAARDLGLELHPIMNLRSSDEFTRFFSTARETGAEALLVQDVGPLNRLRGQLGKLTVQARLPAIANTRDFAEAGGLFVYETGLGIGNMRPMAALVDKVMKGSKPAELAVIQPMQFKLIVNLKTAKDLGLDIPSSLLLQADEILR